MLMPHSSAKGSRTEEDFNETVINETLIIKVNMVGLRNTYTWIFCCLSTFYEVLHERLSSNELSDPDLGAEG